MTLEEATLDPKKLVHDAVPGEEIFLTENGSQVAKLVTVKDVRRPRVAGSARHLPQFMADDFDAPF